MGRTTPLTSKRCILYIYSTNIGTEYFKHALYSPFFFSLQNAVCSIMLTCLVPVLFAFYIQSVLKLKKNNNSGAKGLIPVMRSGVDKVPAGSAVREARGQGAPQTYTIVKFIVGAFGLYSVVLTAGSIPADNVGENCMRAPNCLYATAHVSPVLHNSQILDSLNTKKC